MKVLRKASLFLAAGLLCGLLGPTRAYGQTADYPGLGGTDERPGHNVNPSQVNSAFSILQWFNPTGNFYTTPMVVDNTDFANTTTFPFGPYEPNPYGVCSFYQSKFWTGSDPSIGEAFPVYTEVAAATPWLDVNKVQHPANYNTRVPDYYYASCTPSVSSANPDLPLNPLNLAGFKWTYRPQAPGTTVEYALYVWIPQGPTFYKTGGTTKYKYPQRYYVYDITYGNGAQVYTDVVDTYSAGTGWVRLGGGGFPTNRAFVSDGLHPITIELLNTVPQNAQGQYLIPAPQTAANCPNFFVYADASMAVPITGSHSAAPVSAYELDSTGNPIPDPGGDPDTQTPAVSYHARIIEAVNTSTPGSDPATGLFTTYTQAQVKAYQMNPARWRAGHAPDVLWTYSSLVQSPEPYELTNGAPTAGFTADTKNPNYEGSNYYTAPMTNGAPTQSVLYTPNLPTGSYGVYVYIPGIGGGEFYGHHVLMQVFQGLTPVFSGYMDEYVGGGWVQLGTRLFNNVVQNGATAAVPLTVLITNGSNNASDIGKLAYANAVRFVGSANLTVSSTPVIARVPILQKDKVTYTMTQVCLVADETGRIHCLDYIGNGDGTTTEYWSYPSTPPANAKASGWQDPNLGSIQQPQGIDGTTSTAGVQTLVAQMPTGFNLSTACIRNVHPSLPNGDWRVFIASTDGRIYSIAMPGRGDWNHTNGIIGTTARMWSFPTDYPAKAPVTATPRVFRGSLVFGDVTDGLPNPTVFVPDPAGHIYALDGLGDQINRTTAVDWAFPAFTSPALPSIQMTPTLAFGNIYFGTLQDQNTGGPGQFYALNASTGAFAWPAAMEPFTGLVPGSGETAATAPAQLDYVCSPTSVPASMLFEATNPTLNPTDMIYVLNQNTYVYGIVADGANGGQIATYNLPIGGTTLYYRDNELGVNSQSALGFEWQKVYQNYLNGGTAGQFGYYPTVVIPTAEGHVLSLFANLWDFAGFTNAAAGGGFEQPSLLAWGYSLLGNQMSAPAFSNYRLIEYADTGQMYVFDSAGPNGTNPPETAGNLPGTQVVPPNQPGPPDAFRYLKMKFLSSAGYQALRANGVSNISSVLSNQNYLKQLPTGETKFAFEWGETAYMLVYGFPFEYQDAGGNTITPPIVNIRLSVNGTVVRQLQVDSSRFGTDSTTSPALFAPNGSTIDNYQGLAPGWVSYNQDGYGVLAFTFQGGGANALPPGPGTVTADVTTAALNSNKGTLGPSQEIASDSQQTPVDGAEPGYLRELGFQMANPLAIEVASATGTNSSIAATSNTYDNGALANGSPDLGTSYSDGLTTTPYTNQLMQSLGFVTDGSTGSSTFTLYDRSLMALIRPPGEGLDGIRFNRSNLQWQGGALSIYSPLSPALYPGFEDQPLDSPNNSLDYPDIPADAVSYTVNPSGSAGNPIDFPVSLIPPTDGVTGGSLTPTSDPTKRVIQPTPVQENINVPLYQPANNPWALGTATVNTDDIFTNRKADGQGKSDPLTEPQGYYGALQIYVDSQGGNTFTAQDAYRTMFVASGVPYSYRLEVDTPSVDLHSLGSGTGYQPGAGAYGSPIAQNSVGGAFSPWNGTWFGVFQPFTVRSGSNLNLVNVRLAKATDIGTNGGSILPWAISSSGNDITAWLDSSLDVWSNIDAQFAMVNPNATQADNQVIVQKPRVYNRVPATLDTNPHPNQNGNLNVGPNVPDLNPNYDNLITPSPYSGFGHLPVIGISVPFGMPAGTYATTTTFQSNPLRVIEDISGLNPQVWDPWLNDSTSNNSNGYYFSGTSEPFSQPGLDLSFTARETRLTTTFTPNTATMIDNIAPGFSPAATFQNITPAAMRDSFGSVVLAWSSNRFDQNGNPTESPASEPAQAQAGLLQNDQSYIYIADVANASTFSPNPGPNGGITAPSNGDSITGNPTAPLRDLDFFTPFSANQWFAGQTPKGYPTSSLFTTGGTNILGTEKYFMPAFPVTGEKNPLWSGGNQNVFETGTFMAFVGQVQQQTQSGRVQRSQVFLAPVSTAQSGAVTVGAAVPSNDDPLTVKGKPSVVQSIAGDGAFVFYPVTAASQTGIHVSRFSAGSFSPSLSLNFGTGFSSVDAPSATLRPYQGFSSTLPKQLIDLTFSGKLRGRPSPEVYLGRLRVGSPPSGLQLIDANGLVAGAAGAGSPFADMAAQSTERLLSEGSGLFRARGVEWDRSQAVALQQTDSTGAVTSLLVSNTRNVDRESGIISYDTVLGGKVYLDPELGTVRFASAFPAQNVQVQLSYVPTFIRVTDGSSVAYSNPVELFDDHFISDPTLWFSANGTQATSAAANFQNDRTEFLFNKAAGNGLTARPYYTTYRFGVRLPTPIATNAQGATAVSIIGNNGPYQLDPAQGRIYFTNSDEDNPNLLITYTGVNLATGAAVQVPQAQYLVSYVLERDESPVLQDQAVNENDLSAFLDPFTYQSSNSNYNARPPLIWMFYTSTRAGQPDIYFQTIAPSLTPILAAASNN